MSATLQVNNGRQRKSLAEQIDRLDSLLDGLADNLNEAVAAAVTEAVRAAVRQAVTTALTELLTHPTLLATLRAQLTPAVTPPQVSRPSFFTLPIRAIAGVGRWITSLAGIAVGRCVAIPQATHQVVRHLAKRGIKHWQKGVARAQLAWKLARQIRPFGPHLLSALVVGVGVGMAAYFARPWLAAVLSGMGGFITALAVHAGLMVRRLFHHVVAGHSWEQPDRKMA